MVSETEGSRSLSDRQSGSQRSQQDGGKEGQGLRAPTWDEGGLWGSPGFLSLQTDTPEKELRARTGLGALPLLSWQNCVHPFLGEVLNFHQPNGILIWKT